MEREDRRLQDAQGKKARRQSETVNEKFERRQKDGQSRIR
jgi:hypothetical protein